MVDDHGIVREGLTLLLDSEVGLQVVGVAASGRQAVAAALRLKPDVIVMDLMLPDLDGIDAMARVFKRLPATRVVVLSACQSSERVFRALQAGATGYVIKESAATDLVLAVRSAAINGIMMPSTVALTPSSTSNTITASGPK